MSFPRPRFFPDYFWTCGNDVTNSIKSINSCISIISLCQSARRPFPKFTAFKCALILRLPRFSNKQLARRLYQPFLLRSINISNTERRQFQFQFNSTFNETTRWRTKACLWVKENSYIRIKVNVAFFKNIAKKLRLETILKRKTWKALFLFHWTVSPANTAVAPRR